MAKSPIEDSNKFETERSHRASDIAYDLSKAAGQACLLINGGAATAVIAFLSKEHINPAIFKYVPWCLAAYAVGVFASALALFCEMMNADYWNYYWYYLAYLRDKKSASYCETIADRWHIGYYVGFVAGIISFLFGSGLMAYALSKMTP